MKKKYFSTVLSLILALVIAALPFTSAFAAADVTVVKQPSNRVFYQGISWTYDRNGKIALTNGDFSLEGTVLSYNGKTVEYSVAAWGANMYASPLSGSWTAGDNEVKIICSSLPGVYAATTLRLETVKSISVLTPPDKTNLLLGEDWQMGPLNDVEFTKYDLTGLKLSVRYNDSAVKTVAAESNALVGWSVKPGVDTVYPGKNTLLATFCGKNAEFEVNFITEPIYSKGDVSMDGKINSYDALLVLQHTTRSITLNAQKAALADVNSDSNINSTDALIILQYVVGITTTL